MVALTSCECGLEQFVELFVVVLGVSSRRRRANVSAGVADFPLLLAHVSEQVAHAWLHKRPATLVLWLFLRPHDLRVLIAVKLFLKNPEREWRQLLKSDDGDVLNVLFGALLLQIIIDLAAAEHDSADLVVRDHVFALVTDHLQESQARAEVLNVRTRRFVLQQFLRGNHNKRLAEGTAHL